MILKLKNGSYVDASRIEAVEAETDEGYLPLMKIRISNDVMIVRCKSYTEAAEYRDKVASVWREYRGDDVHEV